MVDDTSIVIAIVGIFSGIIATWIVTRHYYKQDRKEMSKNLDQQVDKITDNMVEAINAGLRVAEKGGRVKYRLNKTIGAEQIKSKNETVNMHENVAGTLTHEDGSKTIVSQHEVSHSTDSHLVTSDKKIVSEHAKTFTLDAILVDEREESAENKEDKKSETDEE